MQVSAFMSREVQFDIIAKEGVKCVVRGNNGELEASYSRNALVEGVKAYFQNAGRTPEVKIECEAWVGKIRQVDRLIETRLEELKSEKPFVWLVVRIRQIVGNFFWNLRHEVKSGERLNALDQIVDLLENYGIKRRTIEQVEASLLRNEQRVKVQEEEESYKKTFGSHNERCYDENGDMFYQAVFEEYDFQLERPDAVENVRGGTVQKVVNGRKVGIASDIGRRPSMEDADLATSFKLFSETVEVYGVFDGHGGAKASAYVKENLAVVLKQRLEINNDGAFSKGGIWHALKETCVKLNDDFTKQEDGTTATFAVVIGDQLWTVNIGDSRAMMVGNQRENTRQLTEDQKPDNEIYKKSIEKHGGSVWIGRVNGRLATARAIGDSNMGNAVLPRPKIGLSTFEKGDRLIIGCDGLWDVVSTKHLGDILQQEHQNYSEEELAAMLVQSAIFADSRDNVSVLVVTL